MENIKEPVKPEDKDNTHKMKIIYSSNFYLPDPRNLSEDEFRDGETPDTRIFRQDGYYHIQVNRPSYGRISNLDEYSLSNFRMYIDAEVVEGTGENAKYGVIYQDVYRGYFGYDFSITPTGIYSLHHYSGFGESPSWKAIINPRFSEFIRRGNSTNSLMIERVEEKITIGINGQILDTVTMTDNEQMSGFVGLCVVTKVNDLFAEVRFRNIRMYSLEQ